jgi:ubiquinone/menaquinone biosynthesis C-methylase UbiE
MRMGQATDRLERIASGFMEAKILLTAAELRVFEALEGGGATAPILARHLGTTERGLEILLDALTAMELLVKDGGIYRNVPELEPVLAEDSPTHFAAALRHRNLMFRRWAALEDRIRSGTEGEAASRGAQIAEREANENFIRAMASRSRDQVASVVGAMDLEGVRAIADLGGGPGVYLEELARRAPSADPYLIDLPLTLEVARRILADSPVRSRIRFVAWDFYAEPVPAELPSFDLVFVSQVLHAESPDGNRRLFGKLHRITARAGRVVVHENVVDPDRTRPAAAALFAVNMLAMTPAGRTYTDGEMSEWAREVGFRRESGCRLGDRSYLITFRRLEG